MESSFNYTPKTLDKNKGPANFKIVSWNVAGLRALFKKFDVNSFIGLLKKQNADVICLQETKCLESEVHEARLALQNAGYSLYSDTSEKKGYCGVFCWSRQKPLSVIKGVEGKDHERGRCLVLEFETFYLFNLCNFIHI